MGYLPKLGVSIYTFREWYYNKITKREEPLLPSGTVIQNDLDIFFNTEEFSETVVIDGSQVNVIISNNFRKDSKKFQPHMENNYSEGEKK